jgi:hypothetical protein
MKLGFAISTAGYVLLLVASVVLYRTSPRDRPHGIGPVFKRGEVETSFPPGLPQ